MSRWQEEYEIKYISLACLFNSWIWTSFVLQNLIVRNKKKEKTKCQKISMNLQKKKNDELQKKLRRETKTSGSKISINLGREAGEWRSISLREKKGTEHLWTTVVYEIDSTALLERKFLKVLLIYELRYHLICFEILIISGLKF